MMFCSGASVQGGLQLSREALILRVVPAALNGRRDDAQEAD